MEKNKITIAAVIVLVLLVGAGTGYYFWKKPSEIQNNIATSQTDASGAEVAPKAVSLDAADLKPEENAPEPVADDIYIGSADAPVTIIEYFSLSCPHCAQFHAGVLPQLKKDYIDTGKVRFIYRDFPLNKPALAAAILARCQSPLQYSAIIDYLFQTADQWLVQDPIPPLAQIAKTAGMDDQSFQACMEDSALREKVVGSRADASTKYNINSTPTFYINKIKVSGTQAYEKYQAIIEALLKNQN